MEKSYKMQQSFLYLGIITLTNLIFDPFVIHVQQICHAHWGAMFSGIVFIFFSYYDVSFYVQYQGYMMHESKRV